MAPKQTKTFGPPSHRRGQGTVEAIVVFPVFLLLTCILVQLFLLAIGQVQLRYAAFCAARVGAVREADIDEMHNAVGKILSRTTFFMSASTSPYRVEKLEPLNNKYQNTGQISEQSQEILKILVHWDYPLSVPIVNTLFARIFSLRSLNKTPTVPLQASWTTVKF
jgi:hypothetical protein